MVMNEENIVKMREYHELMERTFLKGSKTKAEKKLKKEYDEWYQTLDNNEAMEICTFLHNEES